MIGACRLNNKSMRNIRRNEVYQCLAIDLAMLGVISKEECELLIGGGIPSNLQLPDGSAGKLISEKEMPKQADFIKIEEAPVTDGIEQVTETEQTPETDGTEQVTETEQTTEQVTEQTEQPAPEPIPGVTEMPNDEAQVTEQTAQE